MTSFRGGLHEASGAADASRFSVPWKRHRQKHEGMLHLTPVSPAKWGAGNRNGNKGRSLRGRTTWVGPCSLLKLEETVASLWDPTMSPHAAPGPSDSFCIALFSPPSGSCLPPRVELLARFITTRRRAQKQGKKKPKTQAAKPPLLAVADTTALCFPLKINRMPRKIFYTPSPPPFQSKGFTRKGIITPQGYGFSKMVVPVADERGNNCIPHASPRSSPGSQSEFLSYCSEKVKYPHRLTGMVMDLIGFLQRLLLFLTSAQFHFQAQSDSILVIFALNALLK